MNQYNLNRYIKAQADAFEIAYYELSNGKKNHIGCGIFSLK